MREKKDQGLFSPTAPAFLCQRTAIHDFGFADDSGNAGKKQCVLLSTEESLFPIPEGER